MDFVNAPIGLFALSFAPPSPAHNVSGKGLPITEQLRPLIASQASFVVRLESRPDLLDSPYNCWNWFRNHRRRDRGHHFQRLQDRDRQPCDETRSRNRRYAKH